MILSLRNFFVHDFFWQYPLPGDLSETPDDAEPIQDFLYKSLSHFIRAETLTEKLFIDVGILSYWGEGQRIVIRKDFIDFL